MTEELNESSGLWVHQESAIILAASHDVWSFTPEFLYSTEIVPDDWICQRSERRQDAMVIQYGPIHWYMTEQDLWIDSYPNCSIEDWLSTEDQKLAPAMARRYMQSVPYLPFRSLWGYWRISANRSDRPPLTPDIFLDNGWPEEFRITRMHPRLDMHFTSGDTAFRISAQDNPDEDALTFACHTHSANGQVVRDAILDTSHWPEQLRTLQRAISHLLGESVSL